MADEIERLTTVLKDREAEIKSLSGHLIYSTDRIAKLEAVYDAACHAHKRHNGQGRGMYHLGKAIAALQEDKT